MIKFSYWVYFGVCCLSLTFLPHKGYADFEVIPSNESNALIIGGAVVAGAIAGGIVASLVHRNHHHHHSHRVEEGPPGPQGPVGPVGPQGPAGPPGPGFIADTGQTLTFVLVADFSIQMTFPVTAIPFVTLPDGTTIEGLPETITTPISVAFPAISIASPLFGSYQAGFNFFQNVADPLISVSVQGTVFATRDGSLSTLPVTTFPPIIAGIEGQVTIPFTYDPNNVP